MINFASWNVRGLNTPLKQDEVRRLVTSKNLSLVGLIETKVSYGRRHKLARELLPGWEFIFNYSNQGNGRIWTAWNPSVLSLQQLYSSPQIQHLLVHIIGSQQNFLVTFVYGLNYPHERISLWEDIGNFYQQSQHLPWVLFGDFNIVRSISEKQGGDMSWTAAMEDLNCCCHEADLEDLRFTGHWFTWSNKNPTNPILRKLDRVLINPCWTSCFPNATADFLPPGLSDHCPAVVQMGLPLPQLRKPFRFFDFLTDHPAFASLVEEAWAIPVEGSPLFKICSKLKRVKSALRSLNQSSFSNLPLRSSLARQHLLDLQDQLRISPSNQQLMELEKLALAEYMAVSKAEESLFRQKARIQWLAEGDHNTHYFHQVVKQRINRNKLLTLKLADGSSVSGHDSVAHEAVSYFRSLLTEDSIQYPGKEVLSQYITKELSQEQILELGQEVSREEIAAAFMSLHPRKAPGPDGFNGQFFRSTWNSTGEEIISGIQYFFRTGRLLKELNATAISLVPKVANPSTLSDFRPISCCSTIYKCISKVLANRVKRVLPSLIDKAQSAFIKGRHISDNILLTQELMRNYHRKDSPGRCAIKVDLKKAFDTVRWDFLLDLLSALRFPGRMIGWIRACITSPKFSININGSLEGFFSSSRGIRQGDPLSPYLFIIVMDALAMIISKKVELAGHFSYHWRCSAEKLTHLCFADDLILFCGNSQESGMILKQALDIFFSLSGLSANTSKSSIFIAGGDLSFQNFMLELFGFQLGTLPARHMGVPLISTKLC